MKTRIAFSIPIGAIISFIIFAYLYVDGIWHPINIWLKVLMVLCFIFLTLVGWIEYERTVVIGKKLTERMRKEIEAIDRKYGLDKQKVQFT